MSSLAAKTSVEDIMEAEKALALTDLYYFVTEVLRVGEDSPIVRPRDEIEPICRWLQKPRPLEVGLTGRWKRFLFLPRGTAKTTLVQAYAAWRILRDPNICIYYTSEEKALSVDAIGQIGDYLAGERITALYGRNLKGDKGWQRGKFTVTARTRPRKEATMMAGGVDVSAQGRHPDLIIADDLQGLTNNSPEGISKVKEYISLLWPVLNPGGELIKMGTRWDYADAAAAILAQLDNDRKSSKPLSWDILGGRGYFGAYAEEGDQEVFPTAQTGKPLFPSVLPEEELHRLKHTAMTLYTFSCQYLNDPIPSEAAYFTAEDFQYVGEYDATNPTFQGLTFYVGVDPASGDDTVKRGDDTAIVVMGVKGEKSQRTYYVVDMIGGQWRQKQIFETIVKVFEKWRPRRVAFETAGPGKVMFEAFKTWLQSEMHYLPFCELHHSGTRESKAERIATLEPKYRSHAVFHCDHLKGSKLEEQLLRFKPGGRMHDDYPDALANCVEAIREGHLRARVVPKAPRTRYPAAGWY